MRRVRRRRGAGAPTEIAATEIFSIMKAGLFTRLPLCRRMLRAIPDTEQIIVGCKSMIVIYKKKNISNASTVKAVQKIQLFNFQRRKGIIVKTGKMSFHPIIELKQKNYIVTYWIRNDIKYQIRYITTRIFISESIVTHRNTVLTGNLHFILPYL